MHLTDLFGPGGNQFGPISGHSASEVAGIFARLQNIPQSPGDSDTGSVVGSIIDLGIDIIRGRVPTMPVLPPLPGQTRLPLPPLPTIMQRPDFTLGGPIPPSNGCAPNPCCRGQHLNKGRGCDGSPPGTKCVSNRRMNSLNPRALRRATRRLKGFERAVKNTRKQLRSLARI